MGMHPPLRGGALPLCHARAGAVAECFSSQGLLLPALAFTGGPSATATTPSPAPGPGRPTPPRGAPASRILGGSVPSHGELSFCRSPKRSCASFFSLPATCQGGKQTATEGNRARPSADYPVVSLAALLKLAEWYRAFRSPGQGEGYSCTDRKKGAADDAAPDAPGTPPEPTLGGAGGRGSPADADDPQSDRGPATATSSGRQGGDA
jgi:hypothetical protein